MLEFHCLNNHYSKKKAPLVRGFLIRCSENPLRGLFLLRLRKNFSHLGMELCELGTNLASERDHFVESGGLVAGWAGHVVGVHRLLHFFLFLPLTRDGNRRGT